MATQEQEAAMQNRGILTADDRAFFQGEKDVEDAAKVRREKRHNIRRRIEKLDDDLEILRQAGEDDLVNEFYGEVGRYERLEKELQELRELREELDDE